MFNIENAKQTAQPWTFQEIIDKLVAHNFAEIDERQTYRWFDENGNKLMYKFTREGKEACFRSQHSLPMAWAEDIQKGARHCVVCMRDCHRLKVWASDAGRSPRTVCMACGSQGHGLIDLARNEQEKQDAIAIDKGWQAMNASAAKQAREIAQTAKEKRQ